MSTLNFMQGEFVRLPLKYIDETFRIIIHNVSQLMWWSQKLSVINYPRSVKHGSFSHMIKYNQFLFTTTPLNQMFCLGICIIII